MPGERGLGHSERVAVSGRPGTSAATMIRFGQASRTRRYGGEGERLPNPARGAGLRLAPRV
jgi:hypothetical protein